VILTEDENLAWNIYIKAIKQSSPMLLFLFMFSLYHKK